MGQKKDQSCSDCSKAKKKKCSTDYVYGYEEIDGPTDYTSIWGVIICIVIILIIIGIIWAAASGGSCRERNWRSEYEC